MEEGRVIVSTEELNSYGYWVASAGGRLDNYKANPIMLYNHHRSNNWDNPRLAPIGRVDELKIESNGNITGKPFFAKDDTDAEKFENLYKQKVLNAFSIALKPLLLSDDPAHLKPGQRRMTVLTWELYEISLVDIPSNKGAVRLVYEEDGENKILNLNDKKDLVKLDDVIPLLNHNNNDMDIKLLRTQLNLPADADEATVLAKLAEMSQLGGKVAELETQISQQKEKEKTDTILSLKATLKNKKGMVGEQLKANESIIDTLAASDISQAEKFVNAIPDYTSLGSQLNQGKSNTPVEGQGNMSDTEYYWHLASEGKLVKLQSEDEALFERLANAMIQSQVEIGRIKVTK